LTFGGAASISIPPGAPMLSDPVDWGVAPLSELTVSLFLPDKTRIETVHYLNTASDNHVSPDGDFTRQGSMPLTRGTISRAFLTGIEVLAVNPTKVVVTLGDSVTDGFSVDAAGRISWPERLAERLLAQQDSIGRIAVVNEGANGNFVLRDDTEWGGPSALARFDRDVMAASGVTHIILLEGTNDVIEPGAHDHKPAEPEELTTAQDIIAGYQQLIARAHARGLRIYGATLVPFEAKKTAEIGYFSPGKEALRQAINKWIRESNTFDGIVDFDGALRNPRQPSGLLPAFVSSDDLHPSEAGYLAMADAVDLSLFK
jgi:lysophospholipase L1-like esterase